LPRRTAPTFANFTSEYLAGSTVTHLAKAHAPSICKPCASAAGTVRELARQPHRAAVSDSLSASLPVLRRLLSTDTLRGLTLPQVRKQRTLVQRKHLLRMLAIEAGHARWEFYWQALRDMTVEQPPHLDLLRTSAGYPNFWFATQEQAQAHAHEHGGRGLQVGTQAVNLAPCE
jgi:hypothetical protein